MRSMATSCLVLSCNVSSRLVSSCLISSHLSSHLVSSCLFSSRLALSRLALSRLALSRLALSRLALSRLLHVWSCRVMSCRAVSHNSYTRCLDATLPAPFSCGSVESSVTDCQYVPSGYDADYGSALVWEEWKLFVQGERSFRMHLVRSCFCCSC